MAVGLVSSRPLIGPDWMGGVEGFLISDQCVCVQEKTEQLHLPN